MSARVDVITRTKDRPELLRRALASIQAQTFKEWKVILVDSGGNDSTRKVVEEFPGDVDHRIVDGGSSLGSLLNQGLDAGGSEFIAILDDDDTWDPTFLEKMLAPFTANLQPSPGGVVCHTMVRKEALGDDGTWSESETHPLTEAYPDLTISDIAARNLFTTNAFVFRRSALETVGNFDEDLSVAEDWDFNLRFLMAFNVFVVPEGLAYYHMRESMKSGEQANTISHLRLHHQYAPSALINKHLREDLSGTGSGLGVLMANARSERKVFDYLRYFEFRFLPTADKVGKVDARTKLIKDRLLKLSPQD